MSTALFMTFIFLHVAFGLALAFFVMYYAQKAEKAWLKNFGLLTGCLLIVLAVLSIILNTVFAIKHPHMGPPCPYPMHEKFRHERMREEGMPQMYERSKEEPKEKSNGKEIKLEKKTGAACPVNMKD